MRAADNGASRNEDGEWLFMMILGLLVWIRRLKGKRRGQRRVFHRCENALGRASRGRICDRRDDDTARSFGAADEEPFDWRARA